MRILGLLHILQKRFWSLGSHLPLSPKTSLHFPGCAVPICRPCILFNTWIAAPLRSTGLFSLVRINLKDVDLTEGVRNPMRPAWHTSSCGRITGFRRAAGFLTQESLRWSRAPLIARLRWSRSYLISLRLWLSEHSMAGNTTYCWLG
jgi:hypothetical protein